MKTTSGRRDTGRPWRVSSWFGGGIPDGLRAIAVNSGWLALSSAVRIVAGFLAAVWLGRYLGPAGFGVYSYVIALVSIFVAVGSLGMNSIVTRELVETPEQQNRLLGTAFAIRLIGGLVAIAAVIVLAITLHADGEQRLGLVVFATALVLMPFEVTALYYESRTQSRFVVWVQVPAAVAHLAAVFMLIQLEAGVVAFLVARIGEVLLVQAGVLLLFWRQGRRPLSWRFDGRRARGLISEAWPLTLSSLGAILYLRIDQVMLGQMTTSSEVGIYAAAARLSEVWYVIPGLIVASAFPYLLRLRSADPSDYQLRFQQLIDLLAWLGIAVALAVSIVSPLLIAILFGDEFEASSGILRVHIWAAVFIFMRAAFSKWLIAEHLLIFSLVTQGAGAAINIGANLLLIPVLGGLGAAWATLISYAVASFVAPLAFSRTRPAAAMMVRAFGAPLRYLDRRVVSSV